MKFISKYFLLTLLVATGITSCDKVSDLPFYDNGKAPSLTSSVTAIAPTPADSLSDVVTFTWTDPAYAVKDPATVKYVVQIDKASNNFATAVSRIITGNLSTAFIAKDLNNILIGFGFSFGAEYDIEVRVISSYPNNNEQIYSNTITLKATPYKVPPKVVPPASGTLFLVGSATPGGWSNPVPALTQKFTKIDELNYEGIFHLLANQQYLILPVNGSWDAKFAVEDNTIGGLSAGGSFGFYSNAAPTPFNSNFPSPAQSGLYKIKLDFQNGKFMVTPEKIYALMYVPGDYQSWSPGTAPSIASPANDGNFEGYVNIPSGGSYEFKLTSLPSWDGTNYGDGGGGTLSTSGSNLKFPGGGYYKINASTASGTWSVTSATFSIIGSLTGWASDIPMTYDEGAKTWSATITVSASDKFKFRANNDWGLNYGDDNGDGTLNQNGADINIAEGTHKITLDLHVPGYYYFKVD